MRLLEIFLLMELNDRLNYISQNMGEKIYKRFMKHMDDSGQAGLPRAWREAIFDGGPLSGEGESNKKSGVEWVVEWFAQYDPTNNKKYTDWIIRQWISDKMLLEDVSKVKDVLETFEDHKKNLHKVDSQDFDSLPPPERRSDLNSWKDYRVLASVIRPLMGTQPAGEKVSNILKKPEIQDYMNHPVPDPVKAFGQFGDFDLEELQGIYRDEETGESNFDTMDWYNSFTNQADTDEDATTAIKTIYKSDRLAILQPNTKAASCELGRGTKWCTAFTEVENYFWTYAPDGPIYIILTDKMGKFQWHFESEQFMDVYDDPIEEEELEKLVTNYPELKTLFATEALKDQHDWLVDPSLWTLEKLKEFTENNEHHGALLALIKKWEGIAPEETIQYLEQVARTKPTHAWQYLRNPTEDDYNNAILEVIEEGVHGIHPVVKHATENGITLSDEMISAAVKSDPLTILAIPTEQIKRNPDMVLSLADNTYLFRNVADAVNLPAPSHSEVTPEQGNLIMEILRAHPKGMNVVMKALKSDFTLIHNFLDYFGTDPWKKAYLLARDHQSAMPQMSATINANRMPNLDHRELIIYLMNNKIMDMGTFLSIEQAMGGELPDDIQQELFKVSPATLLSLENPHNRLKYLANKNIQDKDNEYQAGVQKAWADKQAAANESITEGVSSILYHVSSIHNVRDMLTDNTIRLTPNFGTGAERGHEPEGKIYYLSTARSKTGSYGYPVSKSQTQGAMVVFDGQALMAAGYTGKAMDYWGPEMRALGKDEMEDRIFSKKPAIPKASKYIKEIHILFDKDDKDNRTELVARVLKDLGYKAKRLNIPLYIYTDQDAFALLNKAKSLPVTSVSSSADKLPLPDTDIEPRGYRGGPARNYFGGWIELLRLKDRNQLSKVGKDALHRAHYFDTNLSIDADIHNARTGRNRPHLDKFLAVLRQFNIKSSAELMTYINNKFN